MIKSADDDDFLEPPFILRAKIKKSFSKIIAPRFYVLTNPHLQRIFPAVKK